MLGIIHFVFMQNFPKTNRVYQGVGNVGLSENSAYVLNEWSLNMMVITIWQYSKTIVDLRLLFARLK